MKDKDLEIEFSKVGTLEYLKTQEKRIAKQILERKISNFISNVEKELSQNKSYVRANLSSFKQYKDRLDKEILYLIEHMAHNRKSCKDVKKQTMEIVNLLFWLTDDHYSIHEDDIQT